MVCLTFKFLPASKFTTAPGFTFVAVDVPSSSPVDLVAFANQPLLLIASTTVFTVAKPSLPLTPGLPSLPFAPFSISPTFTSYLTTPFSSTDAVVKLPFVKSKPSDTLTVFLVAASPFDLYANSASPKFCAIALTVYVFCPVVASVSVSTVTFCPALTTEPKPVMTFLPASVILLKSFFATPVKRSLLV